ncbi:MAG: hypothetical protein GF331_22865 [Chitinivibrionales bacterium]|nr:hypothetical protein [Chitinivibrionales bacterium]
MTHRLWRPLALAATITTLASAQPTMSPFAASMSASSRMNAHLWAASISDAGVRWVRGFPPIGQMSPSAGTYDWGTSDTFVQRCTDNNLNIVAIINNVPGWISSELEFPVADLDGYRDAVTAIVNRYKDRIKYWEVWNEPPNFCRTDLCTPENYALTVQAAYDGAKAADPDCKVGLAAKSNFTSWLEKALLAGAAGHFDFVSLHPYEMQGVAMGNDFEGLFMGIVPSVRKLLAAHSPAQQNVPVLFTEIGTPIGATMGPDSITEELQAHVVVRTYIMGIAQDVAGVYWFEVRDGDSGPFGFLDGDRERPSYTALETMILHLGQNPQYLGWVLLNDIHHAFVFQGATQTVLVTWGDHETSETVDFGERVDLVDPFTGTTTTASTHMLTRAPVMALGVPSALETQARSNATAPFPWGGDYTGADSVWITMGDPNDEHGLHHIYPDLRSSYVDGPYGPARYCGDARDQKFVIDPNVLSYTTVPITITAEVRRNENNDNAGFNLWYESTTWSDSRGTNFKSTGSWYTVPGNDQWYTKSWTIEDASFTGMWGYHFWFQSDSRTYSKYYLRNVSVSIDRSAVAGRPRRRQVTRAGDARSTARQDYYVDLTGRIVGRGRAQAGLPAGVYLTAPRQSGGRVQRRVLLP